jgi:ketosteroid isomerase-like protein
VDTLDNPITQVLNAYKAAVFAKDVDAFLSLYDVDVLIYDMWGVWSYNGIAAWREMVAGWFDSLGTERVVVDFTDAQTTVTQDLAAVHAFVTYTAINTDGVDLRSLDNRLTATLARKGDTWKIVHQHTSAPVDHATAKVFFKR